MNIKDPRHSKLGKLRQMFPRKSEQIRPHHINERYSQSVKAIKKYHEHNVTSDFLKIEIRLKKLMSTGYTLLITFINN